MIRLAQRLFALLLLISPLAVGCGDSSSSSTRDANASDVVRVPDTGLVSPDAKPAQPDAGTDQSPSSPDTTPATPDGSTDTPAPTGDTGPVITKDAPVDRAGDGAADAGSAGDAESADTGATD